MIDLQPIKDAGGRVGVAENGDVSVAVKCPCGNDFGLNVKGNAQSRIVGAVVRHVKIVASGRACHRHEVSA